MKLFVTFLFLSLTATCVQAGERMIRCEPDSSFVQSSVAEFFVLKDQQTTDSVSHFKRDKIIAAVLAFPVPFGFTGLHRIYLGSEPWVPVMYLCTGGGGVGLLPLIDFIMIVTADEQTLHSFENNPRMFMWVK